MIYKIVFAVIAFLLVSATLCQELNSHIIKFSDIEARSKYVENLRKTNPYVQTINIDSIFTGLITNHPNEESFSIESNTLNGIRASGDVSILSFEKDQAVTASRLTQTSAPWHLDRINRRSLPLQGRYTYDNPSQSVNIYVIDSGVKISHQEFGGRARAAFSAISNLRAGDDCSGHGTHVAGIAAGSRFGVAKNARIWDVRVLNCQGSGSNSGIMRGMDWISKNAIKPAVVNMSLGGRKSTLVNNAVASLTNSGITVIVAAGNSGELACNFSPASASSAVTVGSSTRSDSRSSFSNHGSCVDIYAPGSSILSAGISSNSATTTKSGTSMASPVVAGVVARLLQDYPSYSPSQIKSLLYRRATTSVSSRISPLVYQE